MGKMIGLSLSKCVQDIINGKQKLEEVIKIISRTRVRSAEEWDNLIRDYKKAAWGKSPDLAEKIVRQLIAEGKIEQPRLTSERCPMVDQVHWVTSEDLIQWKSCAIELAV
jgi:hypothetical protein